MSILTKYSEAFINKDEAAMNDILHDDYKFTMHASGNVLSKQDVIGWAMSDDINREKVRIIYENDEIGIEHSFVTFSDGNTQAIKPVIVDEAGKVLKGACKGRLCMSASWPGQMRTVYGDHKRFVDTYFSQFDGKYFTGDGCRRDKDGYYWITGRVDDVIIVSGHNLGTAEIESAFVAHPKVAEAAVVGYPHDIKGNGLYCYVTLNVGEKHDGDLERELKNWVKKNIGAHARPDFIQFAPGLPKTRSGKIMRRILRKIAANEHEQLGDTTTLADPSVVKSLVDNRKNI